MGRGLAIVLTCSFAVASGIASAQIPAFPGAEGFGAGAIGGRNGDVYIVHDLADDNTLGTLRHAIDTAPTAGRTIVFNTSGTITLGSILEVTKSNITIAGQTAPGLGITLKGQSLRILGSNNIVRHLHVRLGQAAGQFDSMAVEGGSNNIVDHISTSWSGDENLSVADTANNVTVQWSFMHESLNYDNHAYGSLIRPDINSNVSYHHNYYAHNRSRNARLGTYNNSTLNFEFRNNVIYNFIDEATLTGNDGNEFVNLNFVGNYSIGGPSTGSSKANRLFSGGHATNTKIYQSGNYSDGDKDAIRDGALRATVSPYFVGSFDEEPQFNFSGLTYPVTTTTAPEAYDDVMDYAGAFHWNRDAHDSRVIGHLDNSVALAGAVIDIEGDVGGFLSIPVIERDEDWDSDDDGMPDDWELARGLNPLSSADRTGDFDSDGYKNLEEYLNYAGAFPAPVALVFGGATNNRYAQITNWGPTWQPSHLDEAQINSGTVVVDAVGQHAGTLKIGANSGNTATLNITGGWLDVENSLQIGAHASAAGTLNLSGGKLTADTITMGTGDSLNLSGGELSVDTISAGSGDLFNFTGGVLHANTVAFSLENNGGTIAPGNSIGQTEVQGSLTLSEGALEIELAAFDPTPVSDTLIVSGAVQLGGDLNIDLLDGFSPQEGNYWQIITAGGTMTGEFQVITEGYYVEQQGNSLFLYFGEESTEILVGDYNGDGRVSAADFTVWRDNQGASTLTNRDPNNTGPVGVDDFNSWKDNYGNELEGSGAGSSVGSTAVPEPAGLILVLIAAWAWAGRRRCWGGFKS